MVNFQYESFLDFIVSEFVSVAESFYSESDLVFKSSRDVASGVRFDFYNLSVDIERHRYSHYESTCFETRLHQLCYVARLMINKKIEYYDFKYKMACCQEHKVIYQIAVNKLKCLLLIFEDKKKSLLNFC